MKLSTIILLTAFLQVSASSYSQTVTYACRNESLMNVFKAIKQQTGYVVFYDQAVLDTLAGVTLYAKDQPLETFMNKALKDLPLSYTVKDRTIVVSKKSLVSQLLEQAAGKETQPFYGRVEDEEGQPVERASVTLQPLNKQRVTDVTGSFSFDSIPEGNYTLTITHVNYVKQTKKLKMKGETEYTVFRMYSRRRELAGVDVSAASTGYQKIDPTANTGSYKLITAKEIEANPSINLMERLEGKVPGVRFDVAKNKIQIRGDNNFGAGSSTPLIVIDGFPAIEQNLANYPGSTFSEGAINPNSNTGIPITNSTILSVFNPADIQSITFLKDAAAASIWGSRAANGVIVIETKKGLRGRTTVNANSTLSVSAMPDMNNLNMMNSREYVDFEKELFDKGYLRGDPVGYWRNPNVSEASNIMYAAQRGDITAAQMDARLEQLSQRNNVGQIRKYLLQQAITQQHNLSLSGGAANSSYYISGNYSANTPVFRNNDSKSYSLLANLTNDFFNKKLTVTTGLNQLYSDRRVNSAAQQAMSPGQFGLRPYDLLVDEQGQPITRALLFKPEVIDSFTRMGYLPWTYNPFDELQSGNSYKTTGTRLTSQIRANIADWLHVDFAGMYQRNIVDMDALQQMSAYVVKNKINEGTTFTNGKPVYGFPKGDILYTSHSLTEDYSLRAQLNIDKTFNDVHHISMIGGSEIRQSAGSAYSQSHYGFDQETYTSISVNPTTPYKNIYGATSIIGGQNTSVAVYKLRYLSYFGNASYEYQHRYAISGSVRFDDHNLVGVERRKRAIPLWSGGLRWNVGGESFMRAAINKWLSGLSLRASLGTGGTIPSTATPFAIVNINAADPLNSPTGSATLGIPANRDLTWETTRQLNFGIDAGAFANRLMVTFDIYSKHSYGILASLPVNPTYGWPELAYNTADMHSNGVELSLTGDLVRAKNWTWTASYNISHSTSKVTDNRFPFSNLSPYVNSMPIAGYPVDNLFLYRWAGLDNAGQSQIYDAQGKIISSADDTELKPEDRVYVGRTTPAYFGGFSQSLRYKQLSLNITAAYYLGYKVMKQGINTSFYPTGDAFEGFLQTSKDLVNRWRKPGDEAFTNIPGLTNYNGTSINRYMNATANVIDADHIRLQMLSLGYTLPGKALTRLKVVKSVVVNGSVNNLGIIWRKNKEHIDPDYMFAGSYTGWAPTKNYSFNLNVTF
ncbi:SusC/RagA family TonB-linked outer membrane protein [Chitinophaga agrisoli]|nr:SusC/RagA family TonB-linked outer membrane protein [Chitinophaga agrisoli]